MASPDVHVRRDAFMAADLMYPEETYSAEKQRYDARYYGAIAIMCAEDLVKKVSCLIAVGARPEDIDALLE